MRWGIIAALVLPCGVNNSQHQRKTASLILVVLSSLILPACGKFTYAQESIVKAYVDAANKTEDPAKKSELLKMAMEEAESLKKPELLCGPLFLLGSAELKNDQEKKARALFLRAIEVAPNENLKALFNSKVGNEFYYSNKLKEALVFYKQAVTLRENVNPLGSKQAYVLAQSMKDLANCQRDIGNLVAAEVIYKKAIGIAEEALKNNPKAKYHTATPLVGLARLKIKQGKPDEATALAREALGVFEEIDNQPWCGECMFILGESKQLEGSKESALALYKKAIEAFDFKQEYVHANIIPLLETTVSALKAADENTEAEKLSERLLKLRKKYNRLPD